MEKHIVAPGTRVRLRDWDPDDIEGAKGGKEEASARMAELTKRLESCRKQCTQSIGTRSSCCCRQWIRRVRTAPSAGCSKG